MRWVAVALLAAVAAAHLRRAARDDAQTEQQPLEPSADSASAPVGYDGALGPSMPGVQGDCDVALLSAQGESVSLRSWLSEMKSAAESGAADVYTAGMKRLCGSERYDPTSTPAQGAVPADQGDRAAVVEALGQLESSCVAGEGEEASSKVTAYTTAFNALCPKPTLPGPDMPKNCEHPLASPQAGADASRVHLPLFLEQLHAALEGKDDASWTRGLVTLCGDEVTAAGTPWSNHAPYIGSSTQKQALALVDGLRFACGLEERNPQGYATSWTGLCRSGGKPQGEEPATPEEIIRVLRSRLNKLAKAADTVKAAAEVALPVISDKDAQASLHQATMSYAEVASQLSQPI